MKVAMLLKNSSKDKIKNIFYVFLLTVENNQILGVSEEYLHSEEINYLSLWLLSRQISIVFVQETNEEIKAYYKKLNIDIRTYEEMHNHPFYKSFIL